MKLTKKRAMHSAAECKELWAEIEKSGLGKVGFLKTEEGEKWKVKNYFNDYPRCEYTLGNKGCSRCPLVKKYDKDCFELGYGRRTPTAFFKAIREL